MAKQNLQQLMVSTRTAIVKHSPEILMGFGIAGWAIGTVLAVKATPKAVKCIEEATYEKEDTFTIDTEKKKCVMVKRVDLHE